MNLFCDMTTDSGGWTLVWSYNFTQYNNFDDKANAITPIPNWPEPSTTVNRSMTPPLNEFTQGALEFDQWKLLGREFLIKSNINHWVACKPVTGAGSLVDWTSGSIQCRNIKNIASHSSCQDTAPAWLTFHDRGPILKKSTAGAYYFFDGSTDFNFPTHDPCGTNAPNQKNDVTSPGGNIFVR